MAPFEEPTGVLLVNVGTPDAPRTAEVRRYLRQFLGDPRMIDTGPLSRWLLLNLVILPFRPARSAAAYAKIWRDDGSPLLVHGRALAAGLAQRLGPAFAVALAMRCGRPSIAEALDELRRRACTRMVVFPLFPQYASSTTGSVLEEVFRVAGSWWNVPAISVVPPFHGDPGFVEAWRERGAEALAGFPADHVLFSFHGLPERQILRSDPSGRHCLRSPDCCERAVAENRSCYRAHCLETARLVAAALRLAAGSWSVSFQSRLGRIPWIGPPTDGAVREFAARGIRRLAVFCPSFVADCLETLEEIGLRASEGFLAAGGTELRLVPSLNAEPAWVRAAEALVRRSAVTG